MRKIKFIAYIYIRFNQNLDEKAYIIAKIEAVDLLFILTSLMTWHSMLLLECTLH